MSSPSPNNRTHLLDSVLKKSVQLSLAGVTGFVMFVSLGMIFLLVPTEAIMGPVQRVFFFHVGSAIASYVIIGVLLISSALYLGLREAEWDELADGSAWVAFLYCTIVLFSGMIWGHSSWNTWWRWEPRLVSFLVLWLILGSYRILRWFSESHERQGVLCAVMGILSAVNVPIVVFSIRLLSENEQLHPQVVARGGLRDLPYSGLCLGMSTFGFICLGVWLSLLFFQQRNLERRLRTLLMQTAVLS